MTEGVCRFDSKADCSIKGFRCVFGKVRMDDQFEIGITLKEESIAKRRIRGRSSKNQEITSYNGS